MLQRREVVSGTWPGPENSRAVVGPRRRSWRPTWSSPTAGAGSPGPCARPADAPGSRCTFRLLAGQGYTRRRGRSSRRALSTIARDLMGIETLHQAELWVERPRLVPRFWATSWTGPWWTAGGLHTHERLRRARSSLSSLVSAGTLFTYLDPAWPAKAGPPPSTNNMTREGEPAAEGRPAQPPGADVGRAR